MWKVIGAIVGVVLGTVASYLFKPVTFFGSPSFAEWFSKDALQKYSGSTIAICAVLGAVLGLVAGIFLDRSRPAANADTTATRTNPIGGTPKMNTAVLTGTNAKYLWIGLLLIAFGFWNLRYGIPFFFRIHPHHPIIHPLVVIGLLVGGAVFLRRGIQSQVPTNINNP